MSNSLKYKRGDRVRFSHNPGTASHIFSGVVAKDTYTVIEDEVTFVITPIVPDPRHALHEQGGRFYFTDKTTSIDPDGTVHCLPYEVTLVEKAGE